MKSAVFAWKKIALATVALGAVITTSCAPPQQPQPPAAATPASEIGRYHIVVSSEGDRGSVLFLLDTKEGATWIYRPPQGPAINGFWSDIPRVTYPPDFWQRAFAMLAQPPQQPATTGAAPARTTAPAPTPAPAPAK